jgi:hypothetical protein
MPDMINPQKGIDLINNDLDLHATNLLTAYSARGQLMCHEVFIYVPDSIGSTWAFDAPAQFL